MSVTLLIDATDLQAWGNVGQQTAVDTATLAAYEDICQGITSFVYWRTGRIPGYFTDGATFTETRNGNGGSVMYILNGPIDQTNLSEVAISINGVAVPQSLMYNQGGWFVQQDGSSFGLRPGFSNTQTPWYLFGREYRFTHGLGNVTITYPGGYSAVPYDLYMGCLKAGTVLANKRLREDEGSVTTPQTGAVTGYRSWAWPPDFLQICKSYERTAMVMS